MNFPETNLNLDDHSASVSDLENTPELPSVMYTYSSINAVAYANLHYNNLNRSFADFSSWGSDCTNFVSQCLNACGWAMKSTWKYYGANLPNRTPSWTEAYKFHEYLTNSGATRVNYIFADAQLYTIFSLPSTIQAFKNITSAANKGDILQLSTTTVKSTVHHSTIVTSKDVIAKKVFVTYRNATGYPVAKDRYVGDFSGGIYHYKIIA